MKNNFGIGAFAKSVGVNLKSTEGFKLILLGLVAQMNIGKLESKKILKSFLFLFGFDFLFKFWFVYSIDYVLYAMISSITHHHYHHHRNH